MRLSTILALVLPVAFAAADPFALLIKRESTTSMTSTALTDLPATPVAIALTSKREVDSPPIGLSTDISTEILTASPPATTDPLATSPSPSDEEEDRMYRIDTLAWESCFSHNATGNLDFNAPCNQFEAIMDQCSYGPRVLDLLSQPRETTPNYIGPEWQKQSPETQRACICQSQMADVASGCAACFKAHEHHYLPRLMKELYHPTMFQQYCDTDLTVTQGFAEFSDEAWENRRPGPGEEESFDASYTGEFLSTSTEVYLYYTLSVTRGDAYDIAVPTPDSAGEVTYTTTRISDGQIIPTAQAEKDAREQDPGGAGTSSIGISTSSTSSFGDSFITSSTSGASNTRSLGIATPSTSPMTDSGAAAMHVGAAGMLTMAALAAFGP